MNALYLMENGEILRLKPKTYEIEIPDDSTAPVSNIVQSESAVETVNALLATQTLTRRNATRRTARGGRGRGTTRGRGRGRAIRPPQTLLEQVPEAAIEVVEAVVQNMFTREQMRMALVRSNMNADAAINILFDGGDAEDEEEDEEENEFDDEFDDDEDEEEEDEDAEDEDAEEPDAENVIVADLELETATEITVNDDNSKSTNIKPTVINSETNSTKPNVDSCASVPKTSFRQDMIESVDPVPNITVFDQIILVESEYTYKSITSLSSDLVALADNYIDLIPETDPEANNEKSVPSIKPIRKYTIENMDFGELRLQETVPLPLSCPNTPFKDTQMETSDIPSNSITTETSKFECDVDEMNTSVPIFSRLCSSDSLCFFTTSNSFYGMFVDAKLAENIQTPKNLQKLPEEIKIDFQHMEVKCLNALVYTKTKGVFSFGFEPHIRLMPDSCSNASSQDEETSLATNQLFTSEELRSIRRQAMQEVYGDPDYSDEYSEDEDSETEVDIVRAIERIKKDKGSVKFKIGSLVTKSSGIIYPTGTKCFYEGMAYELSQNFNKASGSRSEDVKLTPGNKTVCAETVTFLDSKITNAAEDGVIVAMNGQFACVQFLNEEFDIVSVKDLKARSVKVAATDFLKNIIK